MRRLAGLLAVLGALLVPGSADAAPKLAGAVDGRLSVGVDGRYGGALGVDLWAGAGLFRLGGSFGVGALSEGAGATSRVFTPFALSLGLLPRADQSGLTAALRLGGYAGADKGGLLAGPFASVALGYGIDLGEGASVRFGVDGWALFLNDGGLFFGPYVGLGF
jgi:hypothetical protein